jgi:hypothetical protein
MTRRIIRISFRLTLIIDCKIYYFYLCRIEEAEMRKQYEERLEKYELIINKLQSHSGKCQKFKTGRI